ncbi:MAG: hybrid sensor histidine kinase/response regulator, partial [Polaribacter sp.]|nr:hybrid sensor histidine kinase/response regulator [Polaribacter sp.]
MKLKLLLYFLFLLNNFISFSQTNEIQFNHIATSDGLSQSSVLAIHQDKLGQMWFGTRDGLNKYDGNSFTIYRNNFEDKNSISNNDILSILEDSEGFIWIGTYNGLNKYDPKKDTFTNYFHNNKNNSLSNNTIWTLKEINTNEIWIGTSNGLSIYSKKTDSFITILNEETNKKSLAGNQITSILKTKTNSIYIGTTTGLSKVIRRKNGEFTFYNYTNFNGNENPIYVQDLLEDSNQNLLIATKNKGLLSLKSTNNFLSNFLSDEHQQRISNDVRKLLFDDKNQLWIGTYNGLHILKNKEILIDLKNDINNSKSLSKNS